MPSGHPAAIAIRGNWWRHTAPGADPCRSPAPVRASRWRRAGEIGALYLADSAETVWAEWYRYLAEWAMPPFDGLPRALWSVAVALDRVADLSSPAALDAVGLAPPRPSRDEWPAFQAVGDRLVAAGFDGVVAPSAARPDGLTLCVFSTVAAAAGVRPLPPPERVEAPPAPPRGMTT